MSSLYLGNPLLPINVTAKSAEESIRKELINKNWHDFELKPLVLNLVPYFLFNYYYYLEESVEGKPSIKNALHGVIALDGHEVKIRQDLTHLIKTNWKKSAQLAPKDNFDTKWCNIEKREQDAVLQLKTAEHFGVPKDNVVVSSARKFFVPFYKTSVVAGKTEYQLIVNAIDGSSEGLSKIPFREKGYLEITKETINDLRTPSNWLKYSKEALLEGATSVSNSYSKRKKNNKHAKNNNNFLSFFDSKNFLILLIILAIILIIIGVFRIRLF